MIPLSDDSRSQRFAFVTVGLILANVAVFFLWQAGVGLEQSIEMAAFIPREYTLHLPGRYPDMFVSMFMHGGFMHLLGNMWFLWIFGDNVENATGPVRFLLFYLLCGVLATLAYVFTDPYSQVPLVGASGAISGVLGAYLVMSPRARIRTLIPLGFFSQIVNLPAYVFLFIWMGFQLVSHVFIRGHHGGGGVAYMAHIGGFIAGAVLILVFRKS